MRAQRTLSITILIAFLTAVAAMGWWNNNFAERVIFTIAETNGVARVNEFTVVDLGGLYNEMNTASGSDVRLVYTNDAASIPCKVLTENGNARYLCFRATLDANATNAYYIYYNYQQAATEAIPAMPSNDVVLVNNNIYGSIPIRFKGVRIGIIGWYDDFSFITNLGYRYELTTDVPSSTNEYDLIIDNVGISNQLIADDYTNYRAFVNAGGGVFFADSRNKAWGGPVEGKYTNFFNFPSGPFSFDNESDGNGTYALRNSSLFVSNTNHYITETLSLGEYIGKTPDVTKDIESHNTVILVRTNEVITMGATPLIMGTFYEGDNSPGFASYVYDFTNGARNGATNGRFGYFPTKKLDTELSAVKTFVSRMIGWIAGVNKTDEPVVSLSLSNRQFYTYVRNVHIEDMYIRDDKVNATFYFVTNMQPTTPVFSLSNSAGSNYALTLSERSWESETECVVELAVPNTVPAGRYSLVMRGDSVHAQALAEAGADFVLTGFSLDTEKEPKTGQYAFIPKMITGMHTSANLSISLASPQKVTVTIYTVRGVPVRNLVEGETIQYAKVISWDGTTDTGIAVSPGQYVAKIKIEDTGVYYAKVYVVR